MTAPSMHMGSGGQQVVSRADCFCDLTTKWVDTQTIWQLWSMPKNKTPHGILQNYRPTIGFKFICGTILNDIQKNFLRQKLKTKYQSKLNHFHHCVFKGFHIIKYVTFLLYMLKLLQESTYCGHTVKKFVGHLVSIKGGLAGALKRLHLYML